MPHTAPWLKNQETHAFLVALDIAGFSRHLDDPDTLLRHRRRFFEAVENTTLFASAHDCGAVAVHFLGDELRLAFHGTCAARDVQDFLYDVLAQLDQGSRDAPEGYRTAVKGTVFAGPMVWRTWHDCTFLDGELPFRAQEWMGTLHAGEIAMDGAFKDALTTTGIPTADLLRRPFRSETGYLLTGGH